MEIRTFTYHLDGEEMKEYMESKGYIVRTAFQILKNDLCIPKGEVKDLLKKLKLSEESIKYTFGIKFAYLPEEKFTFLNSFSSCIYNHIEREKNYQYYFGGITFWFNIGSYILNVRSRNLMRVEFKKYVLNNER